MNGGSSMVLIKYFLKSELYNKLIDNKINRGKEMHLNLDKGN